MKDIADKLSEILVTPLERINKPALTYAIEQALWSIKDLRSENAKLLALCEIPPGMWVTTRDYELEIKLLENQLTLMRGSLAERDRVNADLRQQNEWLRERLRECPAPSSLSPD